jgi:hypothetical protein
MPIAPLSTGHHLTLHALSRARERNISIEDIEGAIMHGRPEICDTGAVRYILDQVGVVCDGRRVSTVYRLYSHKTQQRKARRAARTFWRKQLGSGGKKFGDRGCVREKMRKMAAAKKHPLKCPEKVRKYCEEPIMP